ncbi:hypothetical protein [Cloacibacterium sp.]|uniref:hypothetical protein n=1 Tax=Cloacibacterium sp. TaxID=1913682 RepID=UPI0039E5AB27
MKTINFYKLFLIGVFGMLSNTANSQVFVSAKRRPVSVNIVVVPAPKVVFVEPIPTVVSPVVSVNVVVPPPRRVVVVEPVPRVYFVKRTPRRVVIY